MTKAEKIAIIQNGMALLENELKKIGKPKLVMYGQVGDGDEKPREFILTAGVCAHNVDDVMEAARQMAKDQVADAECQDLIN